MEIVSTDTAVGRRTDAGRTVMTPDQPVIPNIERMDKETLGIAQKLADTPKEEKPIPSIGDLLFGDSRPESLGGQLIVDDTIESARKGNEKALQYLRDAIALEEVVRSQPSSKIIGTKEDFFKGKTVVDLPESMSEEEKEKITPFIETGIKFEEELERLIPDQDARNLILQFYQTGAFFRENKRQLNTGMAGAVKGAINLFPFFEDFVSSINVPESLGGSGTFNSQKYNAERERTKKYVAGVVSSLRDYAPFMKGFGERVNDVIKQDYIETFGLEQYEQRYILDTPEGIVEIPIVNEVSGDAILNFGWNELSFGEQFLGTYAGGLVMTGPFGVASKTLGAKKLKKVENFLEKGGEQARRWQGVDPVLTYRHIRLTEANQGKFGIIGKAWANLRNFVGNKIGYRGSLGNTLEQKSYAAGVSKLDDSIASTRKELGMLKMAPKLDEKEIARVQARLSSLNSRRNRLVYGNLGNPMLKEYFKDEAIVSLGYTAGYQYIPNAFSGISPDAGGTIGGLFLAFGGQRVVTAPTKFVYNLVDTGLLSGNVTQIARDVGQAAESVAKVLSPSINTDRLTGLIVDRRFDEIENLLPDNIKLTAADRQAFSQLADIFETLPEDQRGEVIRHIGEYKQLRDDILKGVPKENRQKMDDLLKESFGNVSGIAGFQALEANSLGTISLKNLSQVVYAQKQQERSIAQQSALINNMRELMGDSVDTEDTAYLSSWINNLENATDNLNLKLTKQNSILKENLQKFKDTVLSDPLVELDPDTIEMLADIELALNPGLMKEPLEQKRIYKDAHTVVISAIRTRMQEIEELRGSPSHSRMLAIELENLKIAQEKGIYLQVKAAYAPVDEAMEAAGASFDLTPVIKQYFVKSDELAEETFRGLFNPTKEFLTGREGTLVYQAFTSAATRAIRKSYEENGLGLDDFEFNELIQYYRLQKPKLPNGDKNPDYIAEDATVIDIAIHMSEKQGSNFNPFMANGNEADIIYRHLRDKGRNLDGADGKPYTDAANEINGIFEKTVIEIDGESKSIFPMLNAAREETQGAKFDRVRPGTQTSQIDNANIGPNLASPVGGFKRRYKKGMSPDTWYNQDAIKMGKYIDGKGDLSFLEELNRELLFTWGKYNAKDSYYIDLNDETGRDTFKALQTQILGKLYDEWAGKAQKRLEKIQPGGSTASLQTEEAISRVAELGTGGYNFGRANRYEKLYEEFVIEVKDSNGNIVKRRLFEDDQGNNLLEKMIREENDIVKLSASNPLVKKERDKFISEFTAKLNTADNLARVTGEINLRSVERLKRLANVTDTKQFFEQVILAKDVKDIRILKNDFVQGLVKQGMSEAEAISQFDEGMQYMAFNGLLRSSNVSPVKGSTYLTFQGEKRTVEQVLNPEIMLQNLENENVIEIFGEIGIDDDTINFFTASAKYMNLIVEGSNAAVAFSREGALRGISPNEIISRAFNLARRMVSPQYVAAEIAFRLMQQNKMSVLELAATDKTGAAQEIIYQLMTDPETVTSKDISTLLPILSSFLVREFTFRGIEAPENFASVEDLIAADAAEIKSETEN